jgi:hypothetical protein
MAQLRDDETEGAREIGQPFQPLVNPACPLKSRLRVLRVL